VRKFGDLDDSGSEREEEEDIEELGERYKAGRVRVKIEAEEGKEVGTITSKREPSASSVPSYQVSWPMLQFRMKGIS